MRSSVISQYDFLRVFSQSPLGHRQRPFLFALQIKQAQMIFQTVTRAEPSFVQKIALGKCSAPKSIDAK
jgi:hypothetical protein